MEKNVKFTMRKKQNLIFTKQKMWVLKLVINCVVLL